MATTDRYDMTWVQGEQVVTVFDLQDGTGAAQDLSGHGYVFVVRRSDEDAGPPIIRLETGETSSSGSLAADEDAGRLTLTIHATATLAIPPAKWALWADPGEDDADLLARGRVIFERAVQP